VISLCLCGFIYSFRGGLKVYFNQKAFFSTQSAEMKFKLILLLLIFISSCQGSESLYFVFLHSNPDKEIIPQDSVMSLQTAHIANITRLSEDGVMKAAGPFEGGGGLFILRASDQPELDSLLLTDPAIAAKRFRIETHPMEITGGKFCPQDTSFTMVSYHFIILNKPDNKIIKDIEDQWDKNQVDRILKFKFTDTHHEGFILNPVIADKIDSIVGRVIPESSVYFSRKLWIAKETFECK
jgi:uncharacterized protein YciI